MIARPATRWGAVLAAILCLAACRDGDMQPPPEPKAVNWPESLDGLRFRWSAEPGINLLTGPAVPLRAYLESHRIGDMTFNVDDTYPGFQRAVPQPGKPIDRSTSGLPFELWNIQPATEPAFRPGGRFYGNEYFHVLDLAPMDGGWRAYVCDGIYKVYREDEHGAYTPVYTATDGGPSPDDGAIKVWRIELTDHPHPAEHDAPPAVTRPQEGPDPAPLGDVFGPWQITGASANTTWGPSGEATSGPDHDYLQKRQRCLEKMPDDSVQRQAIYASHLNAPPNADPAVPGWPGATTQ